MLRTSHGHATQEGDAREGQGFSGILHSSIQGQRQWSGEPVIWGVLPSCSAPSHPTLAFWPLAEVALPDQKAPFTLGSSCPHDGPPASLPTCSLPFMKGSCFYPTCLLPAVTFPTGTTPIPHSAALLSCPGGAFVPPTAPPSWIPVLSSLPCSTWAPAARAPCVPSGPRGLQGWTCRCWSNPESFPAHPLATVAPHPKPPGR